MKTTLLALIAVYLLSMAMPQVALARSREELERILTSVVRVVPLRNGQSIGSLGSGTVISPDGYILTNYHVISEPSPFGGIGRHMRHARIDVTTDARSAPEPLYIAEYVDGSRDLDLAVLRIIADVRGRSLPRGTTFTYLPVGDSDDVLITEELEVFGYPGFSGESLTVTEGIVSGFLAEDGKRGGEDWIKTDARISPGNSGGAALNLKGELVGIPTLLFSDSKLAVAEGRLRPVKLALPFLRDISGVEYGAARAAPPPQPSSPPPAAAAELDLPQGITQADALNIAISEYDSGNYTTAVQLFTHLAELGEVKAYTYLGMMTYYGEGMRQSFADAAELFSVAAEAGDVQAQTFLGAMYYNGDGVNQDDSLSYKWYRQAASQGDVNALNNLGEMLTLGRGVAQDLETAQTLFTVAAELGHEGAQQNLALLLQLAEAAASQTEILTLAPNFRPDPLRLDGVTGGTISAEGALGGECVGYIAEDPSAVFRLTQNLRYLRFQVDSREDTTMILIIQPSDGSEAITLCSDDTSHRDPNPVLGIPNAVSGTYHVFIGHFQRGAQAPYTLNVTQRR